MLQYWYRIVSKGMVLQRLEVDCMSSIYQPPITIISAIQIMTSLQSTNTTFEGNTALSGGGLLARLMQLLAICIPVQILITDNCLSQHIRRIWWCCNAQCKLLSFNKYVYSSAKWVHIHIQTIASGSSGVIYVKTNYHMACTVDCLLLLTVTW